MPVIKSPSAGTGTIVASIKGGTASKVFSTGSVILDGVRSIIFLDFRLESLVKCIIKLVAVSATVSVPNIIIKIRNAIFLAVYGIVTIVQLATMPEISAGEADYGFFIVFLI